MATVTLRRCASEYFRKLLLVEGNLLDENIGVVNKNTLEEDGLSADRLLLKCNGASRKIPCVVNDKVPEGYIYVRNDLYLTICQRFDLSPLKEECILAIDEFEDDINLARTITVASIVTATDCSEVQHELLNVYFSQRKLLYEGDIFAVDLDTHSFALKRSYKYHHVDEFYFKVIKQDPPYGSYVQANETTIHFDTPLQSFLVPYTFKVNLRGLDKEMMPSVPPCLEIPDSSLIKAFKPFLDIPKSPSQLRPVFLLSGRRGSGKILTLKAAANYFGLHLLLVDGFTYLSNDHGFATVDKNIKTDVENALTLGPCVLAVEHVDLLGKNMDGTDNISAVAVFLKHLHAAFKKKKWPLIFVGITDEKPDALLPTLARVFVFTIKFQPPQPDEMKSTLNWLASDSGCKLDKNIDDSLLEELNGFLFADLELLIRHAVRHLLLNELPNENNSINDKHLQYGLDIMKAAYSDSVGEAKAVKVRWDEIGGLSDVKEEMAVTIKMSLQTNSKIRRSGVLLFGPPGTGKTLMAKAVATECGMRFFSVKGPELMNEYVGQSEKNVREVFDRARSAAPCIIFFDEFDSLAQKRGGGSSSASVTSRVVAQLLTEMDGLHSNKGVFLIAATNRPDLLDPALLRPGRLDKSFYLGPFHTKEEKIVVLTTCTKKFKLDPDVDLKAVADALPLFVTGADITAVCSNAWLSAARRTIAFIQKGGEPELPLTVSASDFEKGANELVTTLTAEDIKAHLKQSPVHLEGLVLPSTSS